MPAAERVAWVDVLKGIAISLVVLYHSAHLALPLELAAPWWRDIDSALTSFRMPAFFFASGLFAESVIRRPWSQLWSSRLALLVWVFMLWTAVRYVYFLAVPLESRPFETDLMSLVLAPVWPSGGLWFLHALFWFFVLAKLFSRVPAWAQLAFALALSVTSHGPLHVGNLSYDGMASYFFFFMLALHLRQTVLRANSMPRPTAAALAVTLFALIAIAITSSPLSAHARWLQTAVGVLAVVTGCLVARALEITRLGGPLAELGRKTLPVYVQHILLIAALFTVLHALLPAGAPAWVSGWLPIATAVAVGTIALTIHRLAEGNRVARLMFEAPAWVSRGQESRQ